MRQTTPDDLDGIVALCRAVYPHTLPWTRDQLRLHLDIFPEGQLVAVLDPSERVVGMAASLIITWDDYDVDASWREITDRGSFTNHDSSGRTLYGAEVMVHPDAQRRGIGRRLYAARRDLARRLGMRRIRAGARLRGYHRYADRLTPVEYVRKVVRGELRDPTLTFQLREGFRVFGVVHGYLPKDPESLGYAALIEWLNPEVIPPEESKTHDTRFINRDA